MPRLSGKLKQLQDKKIAVLGLGIENSALVKFLFQNNIPCELVVCDIRPEAELKEKMEELSEFFYKSRSTKLSLNLGPGYDDHLEEYDVIMRSPGYPLFSSNLIKAVTQREKKGDIRNFFINSPMKLFFDVCPAGIIGVTGTKGKGTTASLIAHILEQGGKRVFLGGNIGVAPFDFIDKVEKNDWVVLELSSFQLEDIHKSPHIAVFTNFYKEHLSSADIHNPNYHKRLRDYWRAKLNIFRWQTKKDLAVVNDNLKMFLASYGFKSNFYYFTKSDLESSLMGEHNRENVAAAERVAHLLKIKKEVVKKAVKSFSPLPHRLEFVKEKGGVNYYNDSFATTPDSAITALRSFSSPVILLAGGADKGSDFAGMSREIKEKVKFVILFDGAGSVKLQKELRHIGFSQERMKVACSMEEAMEEAHRQAAFGDTVLLSPGCASFGIFKNYKQRGELFKMYCQ
ncbi:MAG: UDP-N-acetylmuramoyl-L-alanine--D-glutamate ligase [Patescibacteria group bacterium]